MAFSVGCQKEISKSNVQTVKTTEDTKIDLSNFIKNSTIIDNNFENENGVIGTLYLSENGQKFFIAKPIKGVVPIATYSKALEFSNNSMTCTGIGHCCEVYGNNGGVLVDFNPKCINL